MKGNIEENHVLKMFFDAILFPLKSFSEKEISVWNLLVVTYIKIKHLLFH